MGRLRCERTGFCIHIVSEKVGGGAFGQGINRDLCDRGDHIDVSNPRTGSRGKPRRGGKGGPLGGETLRRAASQGRSGGDEELNQPLRASAGERQLWCCHL